MTPSAAICLPGAVLYLTTSRHLSSFDRHWLEDVEVEEGVLLPLPPWTRRVRAILVEVLDHRVRDLQLHAVALAAGPLRAQREGLVAVALRQSSAIRSTAHELVRDEGVLFPAEPVLPNKHVAQRLLLGEHRPRRHRLGAEFHQALLREDARIRGQGVHTRDVHEIGGPRRTRPLLHELQLRALELRDWHEEQLRVLVLQLQHLLVRLEKERGLAVCDRHDGGHGLLAAAEEEELLRHRERLGHVGEALLERHPIKRLLHLGHVRRERKNVQRVSNRAIILDLAVTKLSDSNLHVFVAVVLALVLGNEGGRELLQRLPSSLAEGATAVDCEDKVLLSDAHLVADALVRIALSEAIPPLGLWLRTLAISADWNDHPLPPLL